MNEWRVVVYSSDGMRDILLFLQSLGKGGSCFGMSVAYILACWSAPRHYQKYTIVSAVFEGLSSNIG